MLLNKIIDNGAVYSLYDSSNIHASKYLNGELTVYFKKGGTYSYSGVDQVQFTIFETAESQGKILNSKIKPNYDFSQLPDTDLTIIDEMFNKAKAKDKEDALDLLYNKMDEIMINKNFTDVVLLDLKKTIDYVLSL